VTAACLVLGGSFGHKAVVPPPARVRSQRKVQRTRNRRSSQISSREDFTQKASSPGPMARDTPALDRGYVRTAARSLRE
jgi:hypothetical protein